MSTNVPNSAPLVVICGATATGKTGLAIALAQKLTTQKLATQKLAAETLNSAILSADSRLVYRGFDIGTAKPTLQERQQVPHYLIDICDPTKTLTLAEYQRQARQVRDRLSAPALLVGGTGLYIRSIVRGLKIPQVAPQPELRSQLQTLGQPHCYALLQQVDPIAAQKIHPHDQFRTLRGLEVFYVTGRSISSQQGEDPPPYPILQIGLDCFEPSNLEQRIRQRTEAMIKAGFVPEVEALVEKYGADLPLLNTLGYQEMRQYLAGKVDLETAKDLTVLHTRQFAKQQRTWFRADATIHWFDADAPDLLEKVWAQVQPFLEKQVLEKTRYPTPEKMPGISIDAP